MQLLDHLHIEIDPEDRTLRYRNAAFLANGTEAGSTPLFICA
jgi:hypothetical protein